MGTRSRGQRPVVNIAGGTWKPRRSGCPVSPVGSNRRPPMEPLWTAGQTGIRKTLLDRYAVGIRSHHGIDLRPLRTTLFRLWAHYFAWSARRAFRRVLGRDVPAGRPIRGVSTARLFTI